MEPRRVLRRTWVTVLVGLALAWLLAGCASTATPLKSTATAPILPTPTASLTAKRERAAGGVPALQGFGLPAQAGVSVDELLDVVWAKLPDRAYENVAILPLVVPADEPPLWAAHSYGRRNFDLNPVPGHFVALYTYDDGWQELAWLDMDAPPHSVDRRDAVAPDYVMEDSVVQVELAPDRVWLQVHGGAGAHSGTYQLLSFDGARLRVEVAAFGPSWGIGSLQDLNGDGLPEVILDQSDPYVFCYACGVRLIRFEAYTWDLGGRRMLRVDIDVMSLEQEGHPAYAATNRAVELARVGLWKDAMFEIDEAKRIAKASAAPTDDRVLDWDYALIALHAEAMAQEITQSQYPLLSSLFYGDYEAAIEVLRTYRPEQVFSVTSPLIVGTVAEGWAADLARHMSELSEHALSVEPQLAAAHFVHGWAAYLADPTSAQVLGDVTYAAGLAPDEPLFAHSVEYLSSAPTGSFVPVAAVDCESLRRGVEYTLGVNAAMAEAPFQDYTSGQSGTSCQITARGTGLDFESVAAVRAALATLLQERGWQEDILYAADGPTGTSRGFRYESRLALLNANWMPSEDANCPSDQPITSCKLEPTQMRYTSTVNVAQVS